MQLYVILTEEISKGEVVAFGPRLVVHREAVVPALVVADGVVLVRVHGGARAGGAQDGHRHGDHEDAPAAKLQHRARLEWP